MGAIPAHRAQCRLYWVPLSPKKFNIRQIFENLFLEIVRDFFHEIFWIRSGHWTGVPTK